jgi:putative FmdB family regulatory protein
MPAYDFRCSSCGRKAALFYKSYKDYDRASLEKMHTCPHCGSHDLTRVIGRIAVPKAGRSYANMSETDMLNVLEGGDSREVGRMFQEVGADGALDDPAFGEVTDRLMRGESPESIEADIGDTLGGGEEEDI